MAVPEYSVLCWYWLTNFAQHLYQPVLTFQQTMHAVSHLLTALLATWQNMPCAGIDSCGGPKFAQ